MKKWLTRILTLMIIATLSVTVVSALPSEQDTSSDSSITSSTAAVSSASSSSGSSSNTATSNTASAVSSSVETASAGTESLAAHTPSVSVIVQTTTKSEAISPIIGTVIWTICIVSLVGLALVVLVWVIKKRNS